MLFSILLRLNQRKEAEMIVFPYWKTPKGPKPAALMGALGSQGALPIKAGDFTGEKGELALTYPRGAKEKRCVFLGLGPASELSVDSLRCAYAEVVKLCQKKRVSNLNLVLPSFSELRTISSEECLKGICEGILLMNYKWEELATLNEETFLLKKAALIGALPAMLPFVQRLEEIAEGIYLARDLVNGNADAITPAFLADAARKVEKHFPSVSTTVLDRKKLEEEKMGLLLAVGRGSTQDPALIIMHYQGNPGSKEQTVLIGKGITFDTGGLNLKPTGSIETMRSDMSGAATVFGAIASLAAINAQVNAIGVIAAAENAIDANSFKPGDVYRSYSGKTVEVGNTDAEGRLALADAISYSIKHLSPARMIDFATLTGSIVIALGEKISGLFCNDEALADQLMEASSSSSETLWRMPLFSPYRELLKSDFADLKNIGGRPAGSITAALFLQEFVENVPWAHIDIAGTAFNSKESGYLPKNGIGVGIRLLIDFFLNLPK